MRKQTKLVAVMSAAALLAIGASMTSFAATGWAEEDGTWVYYNRDGDRATDEWKKSGNNWFYLDEDGYMATDVLIEDDDDYYYVDENGAMVTNRWVAIENEDKDGDEDPDNWWYYFGSNGKAYKKSDNATNVPTKLINGKKYTFDEEGKMQYGWVNTDGRQTDDDAWQQCDYYFGDENDGAMSVGWREIHIIDEDYANQQPNEDLFDEDQDRWFYFKASGKKEKGDPEKHTAKTNKSINGKKYGFDEYGRMIAEWYTEGTPVDKDATGSNAQGKAAYTGGFMYFNSPESGARYTKGWFKVTPGYYLQQGKYEDGDEFWYYADGKGKIYTNVIKTINGKKYAFDNYGRMIKGLVFLQMGSGDDSDAISSVYIDKKFADDASDYPYDTEEGYEKFVNHYADEINEGLIRSYYFGDGNDGAMKTGKQSIDIDNETFNFEFEKAGARKGAGKNGFIKSDDKIYMAGKQVKADKDNKYEIYRVETTEDGGTKVKQIEVTDFLALEGISSSTTDKQREDGDESWKVDVDTVYADGTAYYLVNTSGKTIKNKTKAKDGDDYKITVDNYKITSILIEG